MTLKKTEMNSGSTNSGTSSKQKRTNSIPVVLRNLLVPVVRPLANTNELQEIRGQHFSYMSSWHCHPSIRMPVW